MPVCVAVLERFLLPFKALGANMIVLAEFRNTLEIGAPVERMATNTSSVLVIIPFCLVVEDHVALRTPMSGFVSAFPGEVASCAVEASARSFCVAFAIAGFLFAQWAVIDELPPDPISLDSAFVINLRIAYRSLLGRLNGRLLRPRPRPLVVRLRET